MNKFIHITCQLLNFLRYFYHQFFHKSRRWLLCSTIEAINQRSFLIILIIGWLAKNVIGQVDGKKLIGHSLPLFRSFSLFNSVKSKLLFCKNCQCLDMNPGLLSIQVYCRQHWAMQIKFNFDKLNSAQVLF